MEIKKTKSEYIDWQLILKEQKNKIVTGKIRPYEPRSINPKDKIGETWDEKRRNQNFTICNRF